MFLKYTYKYTTSAQLIQLSTLLCHKGLAQQQKWAWPQNNQLLSVGSIITIPQCMIRSLMVLESSHQLGSLLFSLNKPDTQHCPVKECEKEEFKNKMNSYCICFSEWLGLSITLFRITAKPVGAQTLAWHLFDMCIFRWKVRC